MRDNIQEEVYKCSKCGLCQSVCPVYTATKNEMYLPRGRYSVLNNFYNNDRSLSDKFIKDLDICLNCNACKRFCPSSIDSAEIFTYLKSKYGYKHSFLGFPRIYKLLLNGFRADRLIYKFFPFKSIFINTIIEAFYDVKIKRKKSAPAQIKANVVYFEGCVNKYINPSDKNASLNILENLGYKIIKVNSNCCGLPHLSDGNIKAFEKNTAKIIKSIPKEAEYIVCSCDSCYETLKNIPELTAKLIRLDEILKINNVSIHKDENSLYHKPIFREEDCYLPNIQVINQKGACALTENFLILKHPELIEKMTENSFYKKEITQNKTIITSCNISAYGLKTGFWLTKSNAKVQTLAEYINILTKNN